MSRVALSEGLSEQGRQEEQRRAASEREMWGDKDKDEHNELS